MKTLIQIFSIYKLKKLVVQSRAKSDSLLAEVTLLQLHVPGAMTVARLTMYSQCPQALGYRCATHTDQHTQTYRALT